MFRHFKKCLVKLETLSLLAFLAYIKYFFVIDLTPCASLGTKIGRAYKRNFIGTCAYKPSDFFHIFFQNRIIHSWVQHLCAGMRSNRALFIQILIF